MKLNRKLLIELQKRLKTGNRRGVHLNAIPSNSRYKFDVNRLAHIDKNLPTNFVKSLLSELPLKFRISWKENVPDLNSLLEEDQIQLVKITKSFENLINQTEAIESEKGVNTFGFGYPLLIRRDKLDNKLTVAPILIWSLRIKRTKEFNTWEIIRNEEDPIYLNEVLINHLQADSNIVIEQISNELLDNGLITKDDLFEICLKILKDLNSIVTQTKEDELIKNFKKVVSIRDKSFYEQQTLNSTNSHIEFGGLFSIFEVQKQNIINDYECLIASDEISIDLHDLNDNYFQSISSVETDPSQQGILNALKNKRNILIQGPPGTGKSQTLTAILLNALENNKKTIVVCEKQNALEVLHNALIEKNLGDYCVMIRDIVKDRKKAVDSVRARVEKLPKIDFENHYADDNLQDIITKATEIIDAINGGHHKLNQKLLGSKTWSDIVGMLLTELNGVNDDYIINIEKSNFQFNIQEFNQLLEIVQKGQRLFTNYKNCNTTSFLNSKKFVGENPYSVEQEVIDSFNQYEKLLEQIIELEITYKTEFINIRNTELKEQIKKANEIQHAINEIVNEQKNNLNFFNELKTRGLFYRFFSIFSKAKKILLYEQNKIYKLFAELKQHYDSSIDLENFQFHSFIDINLSSISQINKKTEKLQLNFQSVLENQYDIFLYNLEFSNQNYHTETYKLLKEKHTLLLQKIKTENWTPIHLQTNHFKEFVLQVEKIIQKKKEYFSNANDVFLKEFKWFQFYNTLTDEAKLLINELKEKNNWKKSYLIYYLNTLLVSSANTDLPTNDDEHGNFNTVLEDLKIEQLKFIKEFWDYEQFEATDSFNNNNKNLSVENLYNKRSSNRFKRLSLRQIVQYDVDFFTTFFPIIFTSPDVASNLFKGKNNYFDIVIFDEASQLRLEDNLPAVLKGKQVIIAGDENQMPPSNYFGKVFDGTVEDEDDLVEEDQTVPDKDNIISSCESLLEFAAELNFEKRHLDFHYRSRHPYLIDFSNYAFYYQRLKPLPTTIDYTPIKYIPVNGTFSDYINDAEAEMVLSIIENNINRLPDGKYPTIGVATFNISQRNYIKSKILERQKFSKFEAFNKKIQELEENGMFIKNLENIQGDERDVIILSTTYGPGKDGKFAQRFGPINHSKGFKLLNVIITRAKHKIYVCSSVPETTFLNYNDFLITEGSNNKRAVFYAYLAYCKAVSEGDDESRLRILTALSANSTSNAISSSSIAGELESPFEEEVYQRIVEFLDETKLIPQMKVSEFRIDLVYDPKIAGVPKIAIECDGAKYHSSQEAYLHDIHRQKILENHGFIFHRIWSTNWWRNPERETKRLVEFIRKIESGNVEELNENTINQNAFTDKIEVIETYLSQKNDLNFKEEIDAIDVIDLKKENKPNTKINAIKIGSVVTVKYINNDTILTVLIGETKVNQIKAEKAQKIKLNSPLATSIMNHEVGDIVKIGDLDNFVEIIKIEND